MSALLSVPAALYVVNGIGREKWMLHNAKLLKKAASLLHTAFGTEHVLGGSILQPCIPQTCEPPATISSILEAIARPQLNSGMQMGRGRHSPAHP